MEKGEPIYKITCPNTGHRYSLDFQDLDRQFKPVNFDWHKKVMKELTKLEKTGKKATVLNLVFEGEVVGTTERGILVKFLSESVINLTRTILIDPQKQDLSGQIGLSMKCVLKRIN